MTCRKCIGLVLAASTVGVPGASAQEEPALAFASLTNPSVMVSYDQPPTVGLQFHEVIFADAATTCAQAIIDRVTQRLLAEGVDVSDGQDLHITLQGRRLQDTGLKGIQVATALVAVNASRCLSERDLATKRDKYFASTSYHIQCSIRLIDVSTGKVLPTDPISVGLTETNKSDKGSPDYPPTAELEMKVLEDAVEQVAAVLTTTRPQSELLFFDDKACGLKDGHRLVAEGDIEGALQLVQDGLESCKVTSAKKTKLLARAHHDVGGLQMMLGDHESAYKSLRSAVQLHDGFFIKKAFDFSGRAKASAAYATEVELRTREMNEQLMESARSASPAPAPGQPAAAHETDASTDQLADRLKKLAALFKQGLIDEAEYKAKKAEILSEL